MAVITGDGDMTAPGAWVRGAEGRHWFATGSLLGSRPRITSQASTVDQSIWETDDVAWGVAEYAYSKHMPVFIKDNTFFQVDVGSNFGADPIEIMLVRTGLTITGKDRQGNWKIDPGG
jgi:hypothetical protein